MIRVLLDHMGDTIQLQPGETYVGRGLGCQFRLNDGSVSRQHLRISVFEAHASVEDLRSSNGTMLNGRTLKNVEALSDGDILRVGNRTLSVRVLEGAWPSPFEPEDTVSGIYRSPGATTGAGEVPTTSVPDDMVPPLVNTHTCPGCRRAVSIDADRCGHCGHVWQRSRRLAITHVTIPAPTAAEVQDAIAATGADRRSAPRISVEMAVVFTSETLTFEAVARDLSRTGMFVETPLLEPVTTPCRITVLPDGSPAVSFSAKVIRVIETPTAEHQQPGLGLQFTNLGIEAQRWLDRVLSRLA